MGEGLGLKMPCAPKWFDFEFPLIKTTKLLVCGIDCSQHTGEGLGLKVPRAPKWFDFEFPLIKPTKLLVCGITAHNTRVKG